MDSDFISKNGFSAEDFLFVEGITVIGVGGAGESAVERMATHGFDGVNYIVVDTDTAALRPRDGDKIKRIQLVRKTTDGRDTWNNPAAVAKAAEKARGDLIECLDGVQLLFVAAGMGGAVGTGAAPVLAAAARERGILTVGVVTKPFEFEGELQINRALEGIEKMKNAVDAMIVISSERLGTKLTIKDTFEQTDKAVCEAVSEIIGMLHGDGAINVDIDDLRGVLEGSGIARIAKGRGKGGDMLEQAIGGVMRSPLPEKSVDGARRGLINLRISPDFPLDTYCELMDSISARFSPNASYKCGVTFDPGLAVDEISITALAADFIEA